MWRIGIFLLLILAVDFHFIFRPARTLKFVAAVVYSPVSPLRRSRMPLWASYYLGKTMYEAPPETVKQLEEYVRAIGYAMLAVPVTLLGLVLAF
jgi:hypothetical protein